MGSVLPEIKGYIRDDTGVRIRESITFNKYYFNKLPNLDNGVDGVGLSRLGPFMPINPLKGSATNPRQAHIKTPVKRNRNFISRIKRHYHTIIKRDNEEPIVKNLI